MTEMVNRKWVSGTPKLWKRHPAGGRQCPGCHHPIVERLICETIEELGVDGQMIMVPGVGCSARASVVIQEDVVMSLHGRPPDVATGIKRLLPNTLVFTIQGDGDCASIGAGALIGAVTRAEKITILMLNNGNYGTTGGQWAPTTLMGQVTATTSKGRDSKLGYPLHVPEMLAPLKSIAYCARGTVHTPANYQLTKKQIKKAFDAQIRNLGLSFVEILCACPPCWHMTPIESLRWIEEKMVAEFPLGEFKNVSAS